MQSIQAGARTLISHSYSTDGNHQLTRSDYGNGDSVSYGYDSLGRTTSVRYEDGAQVDYTYDNNGNLGLLTDSASGRKTQYFYDFQDRLMRWEQSGSGYANSVTWGYDDNNNLSTQKQTLNGTTYTTSYTYDKDNRLTKTTEGTVSAGYTYDALGRMTAMDAQSGGKSVVKTTICEVMTKMEYFNILYEGDKDDVDIICVPDFIASEIGIVSQLFLEWLPNADSKMYWTTIDGHECSVCETEGFVKWINKQYCENKQKAFIVEQHVSLIKEDNVQ